ncbi:MAG: MFS transporter, partial [Actinobacteria bacterium]|nr:MFS transporter [Actinomycetota bacterium]
VPESRAQRPRRPDPVGQVMVIVALASLTYAIIEGPRAGWSAPQIAGLFALSAVALAALAIYEPRRPDPLLDLRFFRSAPFAGAVLTAVCALAALGGFLFLNTIYLQEVRGFSALRAGLYMVPMAAMTVLLAPLAGRIISVRGPRLPLLGAGLGMTVGAAMLTGLARGTPDAWLLAAYVIFGIGAALVNPPITNTAVSGMPRAQAGVAAAVASTSRQVGQSLGVAVTGAVATSALHAPLRTGFAEASHGAWWIVTGCALAAGIIGTVTSGAWARRTADQTARRLMADEARVPVGTS